MRAVHTMYFPALLLAGALAACSKPAPPPPAVETVDAAASTEPPVSATTTIDGKALIAGACVTCHSADLLAQQRLSKEKWAGTVKKMVGWGANLAPSDTENLVTYLAETYGPDAGPWEPAPISPADAVKAISPQDDGNYKGGDTEKGKTLFTEQCSSCHGYDARGGIGVNLVERPVLYRAAEVATTVRMGRGKMTPSRNMTDPQIADILAYLRTLRIP